MILSEFTLDVLKNFASLNQGLVVKPGKVLRTYSKSSTIFAEADIEEEFEKEFALYDINKTLGIIGMSKGQPVDITVDTDKLVFSGVGKIRQRFAVPSLVHGYDKVTKSLPEQKWTLECFLSAEHYNWIISIGSILSCPNIVFKIEDGVLQLCAMDVAGKIVDDASVELQETVVADFSPVVLKIENLKMMKGGYKVELSNRIVKFTNMEKPIRYWVSPEKV